MSDSVITNWFNKLPVRIVGDNTEPYFYAQDIGDILGIKNIRMSIKKFTNIEIVSKNVRDARNIVTYKLVDGKPRRDDNIILLTEPGVYRLVMKSKSPVANELRQYIYDILCNARRAELQRLNIIEAKYNEILPILETHKFHMQDYQDRLIRNPTWYLFKTVITGEDGSPSDPYLYVDAADRNPDGITGRPREQLYLCTYEPTPNDFTKKTLVAKLYGFKVEIQDYFGQNSLDTNPNTLEKRIYMTSEPCDEDTPDGINIKWIY